MPEITKMDMLEYIQAKRDALNEETVKASPQEEGRYLPELQMWNAIETRVREMTAVEYLEVCKEICEGREHCEGCWLYCYCPFCETQEFPHHAVEIVKRLKEEQDD